MAKVKFRVYARDIRAAVKNEVEGPILALTKNPDVLRSIAQEALNMVNSRYVPMKSGDLRKSGHVVQNSKQTNIIWGDPGIGKTLYYALYQHDADDSKWNRTTEGTKSHWTEELKRGTPGFEELIAFAAPLMQREVKHGR